eukprot:1837543-Amphidinium_carterae.1
MEDLRREDFALRGTCLVTLTIGCHMRTSWSLPRSHNSLYAARVGFQSSEFHDLEDTWRT